MDRFFSGTNQWSLIPNFYRRGRSSSHFHHRPIFHPKLHGLSNRLIVALSRCFGLITSPPRNLMNFHDYKNG